MRRGTTPKIKIGVDGVRLSDLEHIIVTFEQKCPEVILNKEAIVEDNNLVVELTQEETLKFQASRINVQMKAKTSAGKVIASEIITVAMSNILNEDIL